MSAKQKPHTCSCFRVGGSKHQQGSWVHFRLGHGFFPETPQPPRIRRAFMGSS
jgi:hypothetical protein